MLWFIAGFVLGCVVTALVYRNNNAKANLAVDKGLDKAAEIKSKINK